MIIGDESFQAARVLARDGTTQKCAQYKNNPNQQLNLIF